MARETSGGKPRYPLRLLLLRKLKINVYVFRRMRNISFIRSAVLITANIRVYLIYTK